jgi:NAD(P)H-quinone oxidoreductase subunit 5
LGNWVVVPDYHFSVKLVFDRLSVPLVVLSFLLCGTIGAFASRYMHREAGFNRFFVLYAVFVLGMVLTSLAGTIETLFTGWELVGLSSILLVGFFQERPAPVQNALRVWVVYRISDAALLLAAIVMHHIKGEGDFDKLLGASPWPEGHLIAPGWEVLAVGLLLTVAAAGKSALVPFSGWLPRAMEGPTPSSAVFYGALSVHLGAFLLLRIGPILETSIWLSALVVILGLLTALVAYLAGSVQTDIKSVLSYASLVQVGLIVAEVGLGLRYVALIHLLGNACLRTLQFIRAPSVLQDYHLLENAIGARLPQGRGPLGEASRRLALWCYRFALERGYLDVLLDRFVVTPLVTLFRWCDAAERRWTDFLAGQPSRESDPLRDSLTAFEDLA